MTQQSHVKKLIYFVLSLSDNISLEYQVLCCYNVMDKQLGLSSALCKDIKYVKAKEFALRIIKMCKFLRSNGTDYTMLKQVWRSGTSIGANIAEAQYAESVADFIHKLNIAQKECNETRYWIELLYEVGDINESMFCSLNDDCTELLKLLTSVIIKNKNKTE